MIYTLSIASDIKYSVLDILRGLGIGIVNIIFKTIDVLYDVAHSINSLNFIQMLKNIDKLISHHLQVPVLTADHPLEAVALGTGVLLKNIEKHKR